jgi:4-hydroxy-3-methylbut-2-en-1-yl diphosphate synthase IspG/GcpE
VRLRKESVDCPECGRHLSALEVEVMTPVEAEALTAEDVRRIDTIACPDCGAWFFHPVRISSTVERSREPGQPTGG